MVGRDGLRELDRRFVEDDLRDLRRLVTAHLRLLGVPAERAAELVVVANELACNAAQHGGGGGRLRLWPDGPVVRCEVSDGGPGFAQPDGVGRVRPAPTAGGGRGLWLARQLCDDVTVRNTAAGAVVNAGMLVDPGYRRARRGAWSVRREGARTGSC
ncbi:MAG TPA: ATP-binding protein [Rugosimonospora sp.]|nr:ATP-binding protein [Rugosimonospora sp.]